MIQNQLQLPISKLAVIGLKLNSLKLTNIIKQVPSCVMSFKVEYDILLKSYFDLYTSIISNESDLTQVRFDSGSDLGWVRFDPLPFCPIAWSVLSHHGPFCPGPLCPATYPIYIP
jgi:hypothetical protein